MCAGLGVMDMGKLAEWCAGQPSWVHDALYRAAIADEITQTEVDSVAARVAASHGILADAEHHCEAFSEDSLRPTDSGSEDVLLCSIGPLEGVDRLADDQELKFALDGVTLVFGDNASGKSGYVRAARQLCHARVAGQLRGNVFADSAGQKPIRVAFCYKKGPNGEVCRETWSLGDPRPSVLSSITILDTENARVYVEGENEILFLPPEVNCLTRLGKLYTFVGAKFQNEADALTSANSGAFGALYSESSLAGGLVRRLTTSTPMNALPTEKQMRDAGRWEVNLDKELRQLEIEITQSPQVLQAKCERLATSVETATTSLRGSLGHIDDTAAADLIQLISERRRTADVAAAFATEQIRGLPISAIGSDPWKQLYQYARQFAAEAGVRAANEAFEIGDPCPLCQRPLDEESARRLAAFDAFIEGKASADARTAAKAVEGRVATLRAVNLKTDEEFSQLLSEYSSINVDAERVAATAMAFNASARTRRDLMILALQGGETPSLEGLPASPFEALTKAALELREQARALLERSGSDTSTTQSVSQLRDQKRLHDQLGEVLQRREALELRLSLLTCVAAVSTLPVSRLATSIRKELVTPELSRRVTEEIKALGLAHIPLKFGEKTERGTSFFEVALATDQRADKESVLSEGEQRALSIASFLAESHVAGRMSAIIFDDPVTSLDHKRLRKVAERLVGEAGNGRQIIIFTHNLLFYQEVLRACADRTPQVNALPCLIRQFSDDKFGLVTNGDQPWIAKKVKEREQHLQETLKTMPDGLLPDSEELRQVAKAFYTDLRETWERAVEEILLNAVVQRFGTDVRTLSLKGVEVTDEDYRIIFHAMKRASEYSGHDRAAGRQLDPPSKENMQQDLLELVGFRSTRQKRRAKLEEDRESVEKAPLAKTA